MVQQLVRGDPAVLGIELFNEPITSDDELLPFHTKIATVIRDYDDTRSLRSSHRRRATPSTRSSRGRSTAQEHSAVGAGRRW